MCLTFIASNVSGTAYRTHTHTEHIGAYWALPCLYALQAHRFETKSEFNLFDVSVFQSVLTVAMRILNRNRFDIPKRAKWFRQIRLFDPLPNAPFSLSLHVIYVSLS